MNASDYSFSVKGSAEGTAAPRRASCTYDMKPVECHKYYGVSCGKATTKRAAAPPAVCVSKAYGSRQGAKGSISETAKKQHPYITE